MVNRKLWYFQKKKIIGLQFRCKYENINDDSTTGEIKVYNIWDVKMTQLKY